MARAMQSNHKTQSSCFNWWNQIVLHSKASTLHFCRGSKVQSCSRPQVSSHGSNCPRLQNARVLGFHSSMTPELHISLQVSWAQGSMDQGIHTMIPKFKDSIGSQALRFQDSNRLPGFQGCMVPGFQRSFPFGGGSVKSSAPLPDLEIENQQSLRLGISILGLLNPPLFARSHHHFWVKIRSHSGNSYFLIDDMRKNPYAWSLEITFAC